MSQCCKTLLRTREAQERRIAELAEEVERLKANLSALRSAETKAANWNCDDVWRYFVAKAENGGFAAIRVAHTQVPSVRMMVARFMKENDWTSQDYKAYVDDLYRTVYDKRLTPKLGHLSSAKMLAIVRERAERGNGSRSKPSPQDVDWGALKAKDGRGC